MKSPSRQRPYLATLALLGVAIAWGAAFVIMKPILTPDNVYDFLATRFTIATAIMIAVRPKVLRQINWRMLASGLPIGVVLGLAYVTQTIALEMSTAAITGFLTGLYVVLTQVLAWLLLRHRVSVKIWVGAILATCGLALISINEFGIEVGHVWGVICALLYALHIIGLGKFSSRFDSYALTVVQLFAVALVCWIGALTTGYQLPAGGEEWFAIFFTAIFATALGFFVQTWAQAIMSPSRVAIILTTEVVFTAVISVAVGQEVLSVRTALGGAIVLAAMLLVEWPTRSREPAAPEESTAKQT